ncbi:MULTISPECIES: ParB/RepB/Spo0J family partition protein [Burkholderia cepacia complex]|uniref:ParB/RepB/Spo0J family partition protein n=1 Tax=Burkholderia cepacia complex TaxID=87882 RepID=UPI000D2F4407|nr:MULTISPECIES: ParB/RepB/Spo0J family partition protein [Burkholderia cepacia complex]MBR8426356.1 ParB/RepB/Spo0J family partition protein [Burkholderia cenocepacia]MBR8494756.1 ParB/RepB/Spo0J family partition protein [Burkholderia cenocepacia]MCA8081421.1 ParB/RepB/Spo0J family partition protein [Burkholderia cepacia]
MSNLRERMKAKTANMKSTSEYETPREGVAPSARTAPGMAAALTTANRRIEELEQTGAASELAVADIVPNPWQPRRVFNEAKMTQLAESIREAGLAQPIVVRKAESGYQIVAGERRWRAHKMIGKETIKVTLVTISDEEMAMLALVENVVRDDLSDYEISRSICETEKEFPNKKRMAEALGMNRTMLYRYLSFAELPEFVIRDLEENPRLLGANGAFDVAAVLKDKNGPAHEVAAELWAQVVAGELDQTKLTKAIKDALASNRGSSPVSDRTIEKIFSGKSQAGSITKDSGGLSVKIKAGALTPEMEERIRSFVSGLFSASDQPE